MALVKKLTDSANNPSASGRRHICTPYMRQHMRGEAQTQSSASGGRYLYIAELRKVAPSRRANTSVHIEEFMPKNFIQL